MTDRLPRPRELRRCQCGHVTTEWVTTGMFGQFECELCVERRERQDRVTVKRMFEPPRVVSVARPKREET